MKIALQGYRLAVLLIMAVVTAGSWTPSAAQDIEGSRDHPLLSRFPDAEIRAYEAKEFDSFSMPTGRATGNGSFGNVKDIEGKTTWIGYRIPAERSTLEVFRSYESALRDAGFDVLWQCQTETECGNWFSHTYVNSLEPSVYHGETVYEEEERYLAACREQSSGETCVALFVYPDYLRRFNIARVRIIESASMAEDLVTVDAETMAREIEESGHVALYGILFETDSSAIGPGSEATLAEIAEFLRRNPEVDLYVVGHTDHTGRFDHNMRLSQRRANAIAQALESPHGVSPGRLHPVGVGPVAPVASNATDEGRARNRRVELVRQ